MPPVRTAATNKLAQRTERSHEENQERAYIAASRRSDRSLEARVESARRASEIHKKRTGRALRVREEDVLNEEMYEEEDDELSQQMRRMSALHPGFTSFSDRLNSYMAGHLGIRSALQQAIMQANQYNAQQLINPMMQANGMMSPPSANNAYNSMPQSPWSFAHLNGSRQNFHGRSASLATPQELSTYQHSPVMNSEGQRRPSLPTHAQRPLGLQSPSLSHPNSPHSSHATTPHTQYPPKLSNSPLQVPTPPQSGQSCARSPMKTAVAPDVEPRQPCTQSPHSQIAPLTTQLPVETQQLFDGSQQTFNQTYFPPQFPATHATQSTGAYHYHPNGKLSSRSASFSTNADSSTGGLNQTLSPASFDQRPVNNFTMSPSDTFAPSNHGRADQLDPFHDLGIVSDSDLSFAHDHIDFGSDGATSGLNNDPVWNPDDFLNFGASE